jgi:hypothetical protein
MHAIGFSGLFLHERLAIPREIPQLPNRCRRHEATPHEPMLQQLGDPGAVLHVCLPAGDLGDLGGVDQETCERLLEEVEDRLPVDAGALHGHVRHAVGLQPVPQRQ